MPCRTSRRRVVVPLDGPSELQWAYDTTRPLEDDEVKKTEDYIAVEAEENICLVRDEAPYNYHVPATREVPYYDEGDDCEGEYEDEEEYVEDEEPEEDAEVLEEEEETPAITAAAVELPDLEKEVHGYFPTTAAMPPPPPTATGSMRAMRFWHRRLVGHPTYERSVRYIRAECVAPPEDDEDVDACQAWMCACDAWWNAVATYVSSTASVYKLPLEKKWNPYSFSHSVTYTKARTPLTPHSDGASSDGSVDMSVINYPLPPPPCFVTVMAVYVTVADDVEATQSYVECLTVWWRKACQWAAACNRQHAWVNPPPTTGADAEDWALQCDLWRRSTLAHLREEERRTKAAQLEALMAEYQCKQQQQQQQEMQMQYEMQMQMQRQRQQEVQHQQQLQMQMQMQHQQQQQQQQRQYAPMNPGFIPSTAAYGGMR